MIGFSKRILKKIIYYIFIVLLLYITFQYFFGSWNMEDLTEFGINLLKYGIPGLFIFYILYKSFIEKILLNHGEKVSAKVIADDIPMSCQVDGKKRSGKDSSQKGASLLVKRLKFKRWKKELKELTYKLYIYDFSRVDRYLNSYGNKLFVSSNKRINAVFSTMLKENKCFIHEYWIKNGIDPHEHLKSWKFRKSIYAPLIPFEDGLTTGGKHMLDMLRHYSILYMRVKYIPNFIMSNQPVLEESEIDKKTGRIKNLYSKIFSYDYISLRLETPIPLPYGGWMEESETGMFYTNTDKKNENDFKNKSGARDFHTTLGHLGQEELYVRGITQHKDRPIASLRELYEGYIHQFKFEFRATSDFTRSIYKLRRSMKMFKVFRLELTSKIIKYKRIHPWLNRRIHKTRKSISILHQKDLKKWSEGYIIFFQGIYDNIQDSGKTVKYPVLWGLRLDKRSSAYSMYGFKQISKIKDCFGRYDTWFMNTVREAKEQLIDMHFNDVPKWKGFNVEYQDIQEMNYPIFNQLVQVRTTYNEKVANQRKKQQNLDIQRRKEGVVLDLKEIEFEELIIMYVELGLDKTLKYDLEKITREQTEKAIKNAYKSFYNNVKTKNKKPKGK